MSNPRATLIESYRINVYRFALSLTGRASDAEDLVQECLLRAYQNQNKFEQVKKPLSWLFRVTHRLWIDECRRSARSEDAAISWEELAADSEDPYQSLANREQVANVMKSMFALPSRQRQVLYLKTIEEFSIDEISSALEVSRENVKATLSIARKRMRSALTQTEPQQ